MISALAAPLASSSLGAMVFFSAVITPAAFRVLPPEMSGRFLRAVFPNYFLVNGLVAALAGLLAAHATVTPLCLGAAAAMLAVRFGAIPIINRARDAMMAGDDTAKSTFDTWHRATVIINVVEMAALVGAITLLS